MKMNSLDNIQKNDDEFLEKDSLNNVQKMALQGTLHSQPQATTNYMPAVAVKSRWRTLSGIIGCKGTQEKEKRTKDKTELEILSKIPPSIRYSKLDKSTTFTSSRSACTPFEYKVGPCLSK
ncbi:21630_t:CDS:2, partial [Gigaspora rosea]